MHARHRCNAGSPPCHARIKSVLSLSTRCKRLQLGSDERLVPGEALVNVRGKCCEHVAAGAQAQRPLVHPKRAGCRGGGCPCGDADTTLGRGGVTRQQGVQAVAIFAHPITQRHTPESRTHAMTRKEYDASDKLAQTRRTAPTNRTSFKQRQSTRLHQAEHQRLRPKGFHDVVTSEFRRKSNSGTANHVKQAGRRHGLRRRRRRSQLSRHPCLRRTQTHTHTNTHARTHIVKWQLVCSRWPVRLFHVPEQGGSAAHDSSEQR